MFKIEFDTNNAAFADGTDEVVRILRTIVTKIERGDTASGIMDINGNRIGQWELTDSAGSIPVELF